MATTEAAEPEWDGEEATHPIMSERFIMGDARPGGHISRDHPVVVFSDHLSKFTMDRIRASEDWEIRFVAIRNNGMSVHFNRTQ